MNFRRFIHCGPCCLPSAPPTFISLILFKRHHCSSIIHPTSPDRRRDERSTVVGPQKGLSSNLLRKDLCDREVCSPSFHSCITFQRLTFWSRGWHQGLFADRVIRVISETDRPSGRRILLSVGHDWSRSSFVGDTYKRSQTCFVWSGLPGVVSPDSVGRDDIQYSTNLHPRTRSLTPTRGRKWWMTDTRKPV